MRIHTLRYYFWVTHTREVKYMYARSGEVSVSFIVKWSETVQRVRVRAENSYKVSRSVGKCTEQIEQKKLHTCRGVGGEMRLVEVKK